MHFLLPLYIIKRMYFSEKSFLGFWSGKNAPEDIFLEKNALRDPFLLQKFAFEFSEKYVLLFMYKGSKKRI